MTQQARMTNNAGLSIAVAVWLAHDGYDGYTEDPNTISATTLLRPIRQQVLIDRVKKDPTQTTDISDFIQSRFGQALHYGVEDAWVNHYKTSLAKLGYKPMAINAIEVNPATPDPDKIQVYTEVRTKRTVVIDGITYIVSGQIDLCIEGRLQDIKKTSVWGYQKQKGLTDEKWVKQLSIYRWLNPTMITHGEATVQYILLDWQGMNLKRDPSYPPHALPSRSVALMSESDTDRWIRSKLLERANFIDKPEKDLPDCSDEDLWRSDPQYKYYGSFNDGDTIPYGTRSSKNFDDLGTALLHKSEKGNKGTVRTFPGMVKACAFCAAAPLCGQRLRLIKSGDLAE